ncbi:hypothetical protein ACFZCV_30750 [Streptomyces sp. NPDC007920]|uniref:hypothetical protein n=1 Tax=Streptomyces sp. NPDC007920 TaxID=3364794 RepID=UPI0036EC3899
MAPGLIADWAVWGKEPHTSSGYGVLVAHPPGRSAEFNAAVHQWSPGTPEPGDPLPWITMGCARGPDGARAVGVFLLDLTDDVDASNRAIYRITHFAVPYAEVGAAGVGWCALARAAHATAAGLPGSGAGPAHLVFHEEDLLVSDVGHNITPSVSERTRWLAAAAAHLLDGPVAVTGDRHHEPFQLLGVLDSVAALLPFGMRSTLSAASSTSSGSEVPMRLYWGDAEGSPGVTALPVSASLPDLGELSPQARGYHDLLLDNWATHGGEAVVRHLANAREPLDIEGPDAHERALEVLAALDPSLAVAQAVTAGQEVDADRINQALRTPDISSRALAVLAERALTHPHTGMEALAPLMSSPEVSQAYRDQLFADLLHGRTDVARRDFENMRAALTSTGQSLDPLDEVLAGALAELRARSPKGVPDPVTEGLLPAVAPFGEGTMRFTHSMLCQVPGLAGGLVRALYAEADPGALVRAWLRWLCGEAGPEQRTEIAGGRELPLLYTLLSTGAGPVEADRKWAAGHPEEAATLLEGAVVCGAVDQVLLPGFFQGLLDHVLRSPAAADGAPLRSPLQRTLSRPPARMRPETAAHWDVLCLLAGLPPSGFLALAATAPQPGTAGVTGRVDTYVSTLRAALQTRPAQQHATAVVDLLLDRALTVNKATGAGPGQAGRDLAWHLSHWPGAFQQIVLDAVYRLAADEPNWRETSEDRRWLLRVADRLPSLRPLIGLRRVHGLASRCSGTPEDCEKLAVQVCGARRAGAANNQLAAALQAWATHGRVGERVLTLLEAYEQVWTSYDATGRAAEEREDLELALIRCSTGHRIWTQYRDHAISRQARLKDDLDRQSRQCEREITRLRKLDAVAARART